MNWESHIKQRISIDSVYGDVVLIDSKKCTEIDARKNIYLINSDSKIVWQVESCFESRGLSSYTGIYLGDDGRLMAYSSNGIEYVLDKVSGKIIGKELIR